MTRKRTTVAVSASRPFVLLETIEGVGGKGEVKTLTSDQQTLHAERIRPANDRDLGISGGA